MVATRWRRLALVLAVSSSLAPGIGAAEASPADERSALEAIAASLARIESYLRTEQGARVVELRFERLRLLREEMAPLEAEVRSMRNNDFWQAPEIELQEQRLEEIERQIEEARLAGRENEAQMYESNLRETTNQITAYKARLKLQRERAGELEVQLAVLRSDRDAAVGEIDRLLARLEQEIRRDRQP